MVLSLWREVFLSIYCIHYHLPRPRKGDLKIIANTVLGNGAGGVGWRCGWVDGRWEAVGHLKLYALPTSTESETKDIFIEIWVPLDCWVPVVPGANRERSGKKQAGRPDCIDTMILPVFRLTRAWKLVRLGYNIFWKRNSLKQEAMRLMADGGS